MSSSRSMPNHTKVLDTHMPNQCFVVFKSLFYVLYEKRVETFFKINCIVCFLNIFPRTRIDIFVHYKS